MKITQNDYLFSLYVLKNKEKGPCCEACVCPGALLCVQSCCMAGCLLAATKKNPQNKQQKQYIFGGEDVTCNGDPPTVREEEDGINDLFLS